MAGLREDNRYWSPQSKKHRIDNKNPTLSEKPGEGWETQKEFNVKGCANSLYYTDVLPRIICPIRTSSRECY